MKILIVDDEIHLYRYILKRLNEIYSIDIAPNAKKGLYLAKHSAYQAIILDVFLPDINGTELCREIRDQGITTPIIMLSADESISQKTKAFHFGADDYITKPFSLEELSLRIESLQRRSQYVPGNNRLQIGSYSLDTINRVLLHNGTEVGLSRKEFEIFEILLKQINFTVSRKSLADSLYNEETIITSNSIDVHVGKLKKKIQNTSDEISIKSVHGVGYILLHNKKSLKQKDE